MATILVVEDDVPTRAFLCDTLHHAGYSTIQGGDGAIGLSLASQHMPDLIVADLYMPRLDGLEMLSRLRSMPNMRGVPVILLTAENSLEVMRKGMLEGAEDYIIKPIKAQDLLSSVEVQLRKRAALEEKYQTTLRLLRKNITYALPHELRTPLHVIVGYVNMLEMHQGMVKPETILEYARHITVATSRLERLIENYLIYAQIEIIHADPEELQAARNHIVKDSSAIIEEMATNIAHQFERLHDLRVDLAKVAFRMSEKDLRKIILEVVDNAFKFSTPGTPVTIESAREEDQFCIVISDAGRGMTDEQTQSFGAYMQFGRDLYEQQGVGMGLIIAKRLVQLHQGKIHIESQIDEGTTVFIRFSIY